jgi:tRNA (guanosine-2'-O-)-methyltransferase
VSEIGLERQARVRAMLTRRLGSVTAVVEAVHRRHNTSAILRSCEAFGVHEVQMVTGQFRPSRGAARGAERWVELVRHPQTAPCVQGLKDRGFRVYVADLAPGAYTVDTMPVDQPVAVLFGSELVGVSDEARSVADGAVTVPMWGLTESLNVSVAAACILQRTTSRRRAHIGRTGDLDPARQEAFFDAWVIAETKARIARRKRVAPVAPVEPAEPAEPAQVTS